MKKIFLLSLLFLIGCRDRKNEVELAMRNYDQQIFSMAADSIAGCFTQTGQLSGKGMPLLVGRDSIRKFLLSFDASAIRMISNQSKTNSILFRGDTAIQEGRYEQKAEVDGKSGVYKGAFSAKWIQDTSGRWLLLRMYTVPD